MALTDLITTFKMIFIILDWPHPSRKRVYMSATQHRNCYGYLWKGNIIMGRRLLDIIYFIKYETDIQCGKKCLLTNPFSAQNYHPKWIRISEKSRFGFFPVTLGWIQNTFFLEDNDPPPPISFQKRKKKIPIFFHINSCRFWLKVSHVKCMGKNDFFEFLE